MNIGPLIAGVGTALLPSTPPPLSGAGRAAAPRSPVTIADPASHRSVPATPGDVARRAATPGGQRTAEQLGDLLSRFMRGAFGSKATTAKAGTSATSSGSATGGALGFLKDKRLSAEEKLARLMVYFSSKYEKELEKKLDQFAELENGKQTNSTTKKGTAGSPLASLGEGLSKIVSTAGRGGSLLSGDLLPKLAGQLAAPVLAGAATALGMPALAPVILRAGPLIGGIASGAVASLTGASASGSSAATASKSAASSSSSSSSSTSGAAPPNEKQLMTEIQILQEKQREMFTLVSNILRSLHDTKMAVIGNIR
jgi:hypothetical protein